MTDKQKPALTRPQDLTPFGNKVGIYKEDADLQTMLKGSPLQSGWELFRLEAIRAIGTLTRQKNDSKQANFDWANPAQQQALRNALVECAQQGYIPNRHATLMPFRDNKAGIYNLTVVTTYTGVVERMKAGGITFFDPQLVFSMDEFDINRKMDGGGYRIEMNHKPAKTDKGEFIGCYAVCRMENGECEIAYLNKLYLDDVRKSVLAKMKEQWQKEKSLWYDEGTENYFAMCKKTAIKRLGKYRAVGLPLLSGDVAGVPDESDAETAVDYIDAEPDTKPQIADENEADEGALD